jgi:hydrogenase maturation factor HypF (carbamoyltransferase family)
LGVVWDRGGLGEDGQQWGSECIIRKDGRMQHLLAFDDLPFPDQDMSKTGHRIAALGLLRHRLDARRLIGHLFSREEWPRYERWAMRGGDARTSSMIHFIDGVAAILGLTSEGYEVGEMNGLPLIETIARKIQMDVSQPYELQIRHGKVDWRTMIDTIIGDMDSGAGREMIARRFLASLASLIAQVAYESGVKKVALSGDVFTSPLLVSMISEELGSDISLYIHQSLAPTDECINLGQLALWLDAKRRGPLSGKEQRSSVSDKSGQSE